MATTESKEIRFLATNGNTPEMICAGELPLRGKRLSLVPLEASDVKAVVPFFSNIDALYYYLPDKLLPRNEEQLRHLMEDWNDGVSNIAFACRYEGRTIGLISLSDIDFVSGHGELGVMISDEAYRGQGMATEAITLLLDYAFGELRLHRVYVRVAPENDTSLRLFQKVGFVEEGRMREVMRRRDGYIDLLFFGLLENEYRNIREQLK